MPTGNAARGTPKVIALIEAIRDAGAEAIVRPAWPDLHPTSLPLRCALGEQRVCATCYRITTTVDCPHCHRRQPVCRRTDDGDPLCPHCDRADPFSQVYPPNWPSGYGQWINVQTGKCLTASTLGSLHSAFTTVCTNDGSAERQQWKKGITPCNRFESR